MRTLTLIALAALSMPAFAGYGASSQKKGAQIADEYGAASALDTNFETCWQVKPDVENEGQTFWIDVPAGEVDKIALVTGWAKSEKHFKKFHRLKKARLKIFTPVPQEDGSSKMEAVVDKEISFEDKMEWQVIDLTNTKVGDELRGGKVELTVLETYAGIDYPNLAISEIQVRLTEYAAFGQYKMADNVQFEEAPDSEADEDHNGANMIDNNSRTYWAAAGDAENPSFSAWVPNYSLSSFTLKSGPSTHKRAKKISIEAEGATVVHELENTDKEQSVLLPTIMGYTGGVTSEVKITILETYDGSKEGNGVAIADIGFKSVGAEEI